MVSNLIPWLATAESGDVSVGIIGAVVADNNIKILNDPDRIAKVVISSLLLHNLVAVTVSKDSPICAFSYI
jgi:NAD(P)H-hydrate repair Nnr-like enzyme with NAD(P)H-hydrate dehydratase domain